MLYEQPKNATIVMHSQGIGGPEDAHGVSAWGAQRGPRVLLNHLLEGIIYGLDDSSFRFNLGFDKLNVVSIFEDFPGFDRAEEIGRKLGERLGDNSKWEDIVGFPFNLGYLNLQDPYAYALNKDLERVVKKTTQRDTRPIEVPLQSAIHDLKKLRLLHTADYLKSLEALTKGDFLIHFSGTHDGDIGAVAAASTYLRRKGGKVGVLYIDAHGDYNSYITSLSGNIHGMGLAVSTLKNMRGEGYLAFLGSKHIRDPERKVNPENILHAGGRAFDPGESILLTLDKVNVWPMHEIEKAKRQRRFAETFREKYLKAMTLRKGYLVDALVISVDFDVLEPELEEIKPGKLAVTYQEGVGSLPEDHALMLNKGLLPEDLKLMFSIVGQCPIPVIVFCGSELNPRTRYDPEEKSFDVAADIIRGLFDANRMKLSKK